MVEIVLSNTIWVQVPGYPSVLFVKSERKRVNDERSNPLSVGKVKERKMSLHPKRSGLDRTQG